jgi:cytochrome c-type protein NapC
MRFLRNLWGFLSRPSPRYALGILVAAGVVLGILFWGAFNWAIELSSTETFCISCHEMRSTVFEELKKTVHYRNESGVTAICADCHVPKNWFYKIRRKVEATFNEVPKHLMGVIDTREKFEAKRNCHHMDSMDLAAQRPRARVQHQSAIQEGDTCIDCHKGIAHKAVHKKVETEGGEDEGGFTLE